VISLASFLLSFLISAGIVKTMLWFAENKGWFIRNPTENRWHKKPIPSMGGIGIYVAFLTSSLLFSTFLVSWKAILLGGSLIFFAGLLDDVYAFPAYAKLAVQIVVSALMVFLHFHTKLTGNPIAYILLIVCWIVFMTNAYNLIDNMDGLASGIGLIAIIFMFLVDRISEGRLPVPMLAGLAGSILGFFIFNTSPAKIFMGDCGSQLIGFTLACLSILTTWQGASQMSIILVVPILVFAVPIFDTTLVTVLRKFYGRPISQGGKDHTSHRLVQLGFSERKTVAILWLIAGIFGTLAVLANLLDVASWVVMLGGFLAVCLIYGIFLADATKGPKDIVVAPGQKRFFPINLFFQRRLVELSIDVLAVTVAYVSAYLLRYDWSLDEYVTSQLVKTLPLILSIKITAMLGLGLYSGYWDYIDFESVIKQIKICFLASLGCIGGIITLYRFDGFSRTLFIMDFLIFLLLIMGVRALLRWTRESFFAYPAHGVRLLVIGADQRYKNLLYDIRKNRQWNLLPIAAVDLRSTPRPVAMLDIPIFSRHAIESLGTFFAEHRIEYTVIIDQEMTDAEVSACSERLESLGMPYTVLPSLERSLVARVHGAASRLL